MFTILLLAACAPIQIPTSDVTPTPTSPPAPSPEVRASGSEVSPTPTATPTIFPLPEGGAIVVGVAGDMNLDVNAMTPFLRDAIFDSLVRPNPLTGALERGLAESFQVSPDALSMTFRLQQGIQWHNGDALTADDVAATLNAFASPDFRGVPVTDFGTFVKATALDDRTVQLTFRETNCPALTGIATLKILPRAVANSLNFPRLKPEQLMGTGPLKIAARGDDQFVLTRNSSYYLGQPPIESWTLKFYPNAAALRSAFAAKQIDVMATAPGEYGAIKNLAGATFLRAAAPEYIALVFNTDTVALNDGRVRQALNYALDRNLLLEDLGGQALPVDSSALPTFWANDPNPPRYSFDLAKAKEILAGAGWRASGDGVLRKDGRAMSLQLWTEADDPILEPLAFRLREMYAALGIQVELQLDDRPGVLTRAFQHRFDLLLIRRKLPLDPDQRWYWQSDQNAKGSGFNIGSYSNPRVDALFKETLRVNACDPSGRAALFGEINRNLVIDPPAVFMFAPLRYLVTRDRVFNAAPSAFAGDFWNLKDWRVRP
ncbi:MAG: hypothetical protein HY782_02135 [Chloroflexi bacterium]|nr:hypothetical protein [Chloroflexota bacterium]